MGLVRTKWTIAAVAAAAVWAVATDAMAQAPIKIGIVQTYSGPLSSPGTDASNGFTLYFEEAGNKVAGRAVQLIKEDDAGNPAQGMERVRRLVEREEVQILAGITNSAVAYAVRDYVNGKAVPLVIMGAAGANGITDAQASPYIFRASFSNRQFNAPVGPYVCRKLGYKKIVIMASDYVTGYEFSGAFKDSYKKAGCEVVKEIFAPLGTVDFAPFLSQVPTNQADAVWAMFFGADAIGYIKQYDAFGLKTKLPLVGSGGPADERLLQAMGPSGVGTISSTYYTAALDNPANKAFIQAYRAKYKIPTASTSASGYIAAQAIAAAIEAVDGKVEDKEKFLEALRKVDLPSTPIGRFRFDNKQNIVFDLYVTRTVQRNGEFVLEVVEKLADNVDQFWQYQ